MKDFDFHNIKDSLHRLENVEHSFTEAPEQYWRYAIFFFTGLLLAGILLDGFIFWRFALRKESQDLSNIIIHVAQLDEKKFGQVLKSIESKRAAIEAGAAQSTPPNPFGDVAEPANH